MKNFIKLDPSDIKEGIRFSAPVFFEDGKNMFLAEGKSVKQYHLKALKRWQVPFLLTYGHELKNDEGLLTKNRTSGSANSPAAEELEELGELEELEEI